MGTSSTRTTVPAASTPTETVPTPVLLKEPGPSGFRHLNGRGLRLAIVSTRWFHKDIVGPLVTACANELLEKGVQHSDLKRIEVSGAFEMPFAAARVLQTKGSAVDAVICIGCMVQGGTLAYEFVSEAVTMGIMKLNVMHEIPVVNGLLTCANENEARACAEFRGTCIDGHSGKRQCNHGVAWAQEALELAWLKRATAEMQEKTCRCSCHCPQENCQCTCHCQQCACRICSCAGEEKAASGCECPRCIHDEKQSTSSSRRHDTEAWDVLSTTCTGCGHVGRACHCENCHCATCALVRLGRRAQEKASDAMSMAICAGCGRSGSACHCKGCNCAHCGLMGHKQGHASPAHEKKKEERKGESTKSSTESGTIAAGKVAM